MIHRARPKARPTLLTLLAALGGVALALASVRVAAAAPPRLQDIAVEPGEVTLLPRGGQTFQATGVYSDGTTQDLTGQVLWKARDPRVATIDASGVATAIDGGRTDITATLASAGVTSRRAARLTVPDLEEVAVDPAAVGVRVGGQVALRALGSFEDGTTGVDITDQVEWSSKKLSVVKIDHDALGQVVAVGAALGQTNVVALHARSGVRSTPTTGRIKVVGSLVSLEVTPDSRVVRIGERTRFKATGTFERGVTADVSGNVAWSTASPEVATIDELGRATGVAMGSTSIVATDSATGISSTTSAGDARLDVVGDITSLQVKPNPVGMALGAKANLKAQATFVGLTGRLNVTSRMTWVSSDPGLVSVDRRGAASCLAAGTVTVSVRDPISGLTSSSTGGDAVVHCGVPVTGVRIVPETLSLRAGKSKKVKAYLIYADDSRDEITKRVTWSSSDLLVATVERAEPNIGRVNAQTPGQATISADDPTTGLSSSAPGGASCVVTVKP